MMLKSPMNYIGGKYKLLSQILPLFPEDIHTFVDLFAGGLDIAINIHSDNIICNDINHYLIGMYVEMQHMNIDALLRRIHFTINEFALSKTNREGYIALRNRFNAEHDNIDLFLLICYGFNHQLRFNNNGEFNNPFGINRSSYNEKIENNLIAWHTYLQQMHFVATDFRNIDLQNLGPRDFVYADPPYLISCGSYNDGKRGFEGWREQDDLDLFTLLDQLDDRGVRFALSNVIEHKGTINTHLNDWRRRYHTHFLNANYANSSYQYIDKTAKTKEVLITNY